MDSTLQKKIIKLIEPKNLLELEEELKEILQAERALVKFANRLNVTPSRLQQVIDDIIDIINLIQI
jgi:DNA-directed RNA polymerase subunit F